MIIIFSALKIEISGFLKDIKASILKKSGRTEIYAGSYKSKKILAVISGTGKNNATAAADMLANIINRKGSYCDLSIRCRKINLEKIEKIFIAGVSGALTENSKSGDIIICNKVIDSSNPEQERKRGKRFFSLDSTSNETVSMLESCYCRVFKMTAVTSLNLLCTNKEKEYFNKNYGAQIVDMESFWIIKSLIKFKIPILCIRAISDELYDELPHFFKDIDFKDCLSFLKIIFGILKSLRDTKKMIHVIKNFNKSRKSLKTAIEYVLSKT